MNADVEKAVKRMDRSNQLRGVVFGRLAFDDWETVHQSLRDQEALLRAVLNDNHATGHTTPETLDRITAHLGATP